MDKERIIELIIVKNRSFDLGTGRKIRRTLSLRNFQRKKKVRTLSSGRTHKILVLVKGDRQI
jgi:hypothetical protein